jgi:hypothetical protein
MNIKTLAAPRTNTLVRVWRPTGNPKMPLACVWEQADSPRAGAASLCV